MQTKGRKNELTERRLSVKQVASILSVHPSAVRCWERKGLLMAYRVGPRRSFRFAEDGILDFVSNSTKEVNMGVSK